jgi:hypothetical protein
VWEWGALEGACAAAVLLNDGPLMHDPLPRLVANEACGLQPAPDGGAALECRASLVGDLAAGEHFVTAAVHCRAAGSSALPYRAAAAHTLRFIVSAA